MAVPGQTAAPTPAPTPTTAPVPAPSGSCSTPDPFVSIGGGTCYAGDWLPPGMTPPNVQVVIDVATSGTIRRDAATGEWFIEGDDDQLYSSPSDLADELLVDGARVSFQGTVISEPTAQSAFWVVEIQVFVLL